MHFGVHPVDAVVCPAKKGRVSAFSPKQVAAAVVVQNGLVLVTRRAPGQNLAGLWEFPGGKLEGGESPQQCIVRELAEELGIRVLVGRIITESRFDYPGGAINLIAVETQIIEGDITLSVHDAFEWLPPESLLERDLAPADIPIARELIRRTASEQAPALRSRS